MKRFRRSLLIILSFFLLQTMKLTPGIAPEAAGTKIRSKRLLYHSSAKEV